MKSTEDGGLGPDCNPLNFLHRDSICFAQPRPYVISLPGVEGFNDELARLYSSHENDALTELVEIKTKLRNASSEDFWESITEGLARLTRAQCAFVSKRILSDEQNLPVEMPLIGEPGSCLMATSLFFEDGKGHAQTTRNQRYHAYQCPCAFMRHDKVFIIPERFGDFVTNNPNTLPQSMESYIGLPLFAEGKCFAHFGVMWSHEGTANRKLGWGFIEMMLHAMEDMILQRLLTGESFPTNAIASSKLRQVIPHNAIATQQSLKPYARSLSHELRTPMQGVVGVLDVMYATLQEASEEQINPRMNKVFEQLKHNIETVQDSARRAVEAADNVVHAYDMNMGVPEDSDMEPSTPSLLHELSTGPDRDDRRPDIVIAGSDLPIAPRSHKRRRESVVWNEESPRKIRATDASSSANAHPRLASEMNDALRQHSRMTVPHLTAEPENLVTDAISELETQHVVVPGLRHANLSEILSYVVNDSLKVGGRPETTIARQDDFGETIEVRSIYGDHSEKVKIVEWLVDPSVPESILVDEKDLSKMISCVVLNAVKFTDEGRITIKARLSSSGKYVVIAVADTGPGIPENFLPSLFKAFSQEDNTRTRKTEGLGLGLLVAKGISRRLGGSLTCTRADTAGPLKGTEFEMRVPVIAVEHRPRSGSHSPALSRSHTPHASVDSSLGTVPSLSPERLASPDYFIPQPPPFRRSLSRQSMRDALNTPPPTTAPRHYQNHKVRRSNKRKQFDSDLARKHPLNFLVAEDNKINRTLLINMLHKMGYQNVYEAHDGTEAVRQMEIQRMPGAQIDMVLMDLWMPLMDGYEATEKIFNMPTSNGIHGKSPTILAVTADVTEDALERAWRVGMKGLMTKPYKLFDLEGLILEYCAVAAS
ncbi:MAG: hypothetical protein M1820_010575 [Bogoriella megaspora]|nr:MAG: hypothetical protein M1820_010575 [Bogoriella megaspora]